MMKSSSLNGRQQAGNYLLTKDVTLSDTYKLDTTLAVHICLNGHTVRKENGGELIRLEGNADNGKKPELSIYDCSEGETGKLTGASDGYGAVVVYGNAIFTLNGGNVSGNDTTGIYSNWANSVVNINGGTVSGNNGSNSHQHTGGVYARMTTFRMNGGSISDNRGVGVELKYNTSFRMNGGSITGNTTLENYNYKAAGMYVAEDVAELKISGNDRINITGNTCRGEERNVYFYVFGSRKCPMSFGDGVVLDDKSRIGICTSGTVTEDEPFVFTSGLGDHADLKVFTSDNGEYQVRKNSGGEAELYYDPIDINVSFDANGGTGSMAADTTKYNQDYQLPQCGFDPAEGYVYDGWIIDGEQYEERAIVKLKKDTVVKAGWKTIPYTIGYDLAGGSLEEGASNPEEYDVESEAITLANPVKEHYDFVGWTGTDLTEPSTEVSFAIRSA